MFDDDSDDELTQLVPNWYDGWYLYATIIRILDIVIWGSGKLDDYYCCYCYYYYYSLAHLLRVNNLNNIATGSNQFFLTYLITWAIINGNFYISD